MELISWPSVCQPNQHRAPLKREIDWKQGGQILLSFTPSGWAVWTGLRGLDCQDDLASCSLPAAFQQQQPLLHRSCKENADAGAELEGLCHPESMQLCRWFTLDPNLCTFLSQISHSGWLKILILTLLPSHQSHRIVQDGYFFLCKGENIFSS